MENDLKRIMNNQASKSEIHNNFDKFDDYFKIILDNMTNLFTILNENFEFELFNEDTFKKILGYSKEDLIKNPFFSIVHPDDVKNDLNISRNDIIQSLHPIEMRLKHKLGSYLYFEVNGFPVFNKINNKKILIILENITERKKIENKISEIEQNFKRFAENLNDLVLILDENYQFEYINEEVLLKLLGYYNADIKGDLILNYIHKDDVELFINSLNEKDDEKEKIVSEIRFKQKNNTWTWFEYHDKKYFDKNGKQKWLIILRSISERKLAEERYKNLFENSPNGIILIDLDGRVIDLNSAFLKILRSQKDYYVGKNIHDLEDIFNPDIKYYYKKIFEASFKSDFPDPLEIQVKNRNDEYIWVNILASLFKIQDKTLIQFIFQDISENKKAQLLERQFKEQLGKEVQIRTKELNDTLEQQQLYLDHILKSSQFKTEFMSTMSHELRTPLNAIIGFSDLLLELLYGPLNEQQLEFIKDIKSSAEHQYDMIKNILDISKIEAGQITLNIQKFPLNNIVDQIKSTLRPLYKKKGLKFKVKGLETEKEIYADPIRFKEILFNLLDNAVKYTARGQITFTVQEKFDHWLFKVTDTGIGIATKDYDLIFKEFKRVDSAYVRSVPGTGLGLSLTKRLVNLHGGEISFFSVEGAGTTFSFSILKKLENKLTNS